jgi:hypothetical protein
MITDDRPCAAWEIAIAWHQGQVITGGCRVPGGWLPCCGGLPGRSRVVSVQVTGGFRVAGPFPCDNTKAIRNTETLQRTHAQ